MRILLTGGTGFIGNKLAQLLRQRGDQVVIVSRGGRGDVTWGDLGVQTEQADAVVHLAGEPIAPGRWTRARLERIRASRVETTAELVRTIHRAVHKPRVLVSASGVGIYGMRLDQDVLDERAAPPSGGATPADVPASICIAWEAAAQPARASGVRVVNPRFGMVVGRGGGALARMEPAFRWGVGGALGSGKQWVSWVHVRDAVRALVFAIDHDTVQGAVNVTAPYPVTMNDFAHALGRALGRPAMVRVPAFVLHLALGRGLAQVLVTGQRVVPRKLTQTGFAFELPRIEEALSEIYGDRQAAR